MHRLIFAFVPLAFSIPGCGAAPSAGAGTSTLAETGMETETDHGDDDATDSGNETCATTPDLGPVVRVTLRNDRPRPVVVANTLSSDCYDDIVPLAIADQDGPFLWRTTQQFPCTHFADGGGCDYGCGALQAAICLEPGGSYDDEWLGNRWLVQDTPAACGAPEHCQECVVEEAVAPGTYTITAQALEVDECDCVSDGADGWCHVESLQVDPDVERSGGLDYPTETELVLVLE